MDKTWWDDDSALPILSGVPAKIPRRQKVLVWAYRVSIIASVILFACILSAIYDRRINMSVPREWDTLSSVLDMIMSNCRTIDYRQHRTSLCCRWLISKQASWYPWHRCRSSRFWSHIDQYISAKEHSEFQPPIRIWNHETRDPRGVWPYSSLITGRSTVKLQAE